MNLYQINLIVNYNFYLFLDEQVLFFFSLSSIYLYNIVTVNFYYSKKYFFFFIIMSGYFMRT